MKKVKAYNSEMVAILCTDQKEISVAVRAMKNGAFDYLAKSDSIKEGLAVIIKSMEDMQVFAEKVY
jgi:DNA-binding NtrC family response regulator